MHSIPGVNGGEVPAGNRAEADIREAEQNLVAANANIGVAKAQFFLQIWLLGSGAGAWGIAPSWDRISRPLSRLEVTRQARLSRFLKVGTCVTTCAMTKSQERQAVISYEQTIQRAFGDVSDALIGYEKYQAVRERQE